MHIFGLHSPSKCWIFKVFLFSILIFHRVFILSLSDQVLGSRSPCAYLIYTLQADFGFFFFFFFNLNFSWGFHPLALQTGFTFSLSIFSQSGFFMTFHTFYTITLQAGCKFSLLMQIFGLHSPSRCLLLFFVYVSQT